MAYIPDPTDASQPTEDVKARTAAAEFRAIKAYLNGIVAGGLPPITGQAGNSLVVNNSGGFTWSAAPSLYLFNTLT